MNRIQKHVGSGSAIGLTYAVSFLVAGIYWPFLPLILHNQGLSDTETSIAMSAGGIATIIAPPLFAHLADRTFAFRYLMAFLLLACSVTFAFLPYATTLIAAFLAIFLINAFMMPAFALIDSFTMDFILRSPRGERTRDFSHYRVWGSIGFVVPTALMALLFSPESVDTSTLISFAVLGGVLATICAFALPHNTPTRHDAELPSKAALQAIQRPPLRGLFIAGSILALSVAMYVIIYPRFLQEIGFSPITVGLILNLGVAAEIIALHFAGPLIRRLGLWTLIIAGMANLPLRVAINLLWPTIPVAFVVQLSQSLFGIGIFVALPMLLQEHAAPSFRHSIQSLNAVITSGVMRLAGPLVGAGIIATAPGDDLAGLTRALMGATILGVIATLSLWLSRKKALRAS